MSVFVSVQIEDFDVGAELERLEALGGGAVASFVGIVRGGEGLTALTLEAHEAMAQTALEGLAEKACRRWPLAGLTLVHRRGLLPVGSRIVLAAAASRHRAAALEACAFLIDWTKTGAPFWKQEHFADGRAQWVEARAEDEAASRRWNR